LQPDLALTAKTAKTVEFYRDGQCTAALAMPASVHELARSPDGSKLFGSVYGGGTFGRNVAPDRRIVIIDVATQSVDGFISTGVPLAPHGLKFGPDGLLWVTAELDKAIFAVDPVQRRVVASIATGAAAHWLDVDQQDRFLYLANKGATALGILDLRARRVVHQLEVPGGCEGLTLSTDGSWLFVASHETAQVHMVDVRTNRIVRSACVRASAGKGCQLRRVRTSPDDQWLLMSSHQDGEVAIFSLPDLVQSALVQVGRGPMGFSFPDKGGEALVCVHDEARVARLDLACGKLLSAFATGEGCEYVQFLG